MNVLTLNSGSSSVKYQLINTADQNVLCLGIVERIGIQGTRMKHKRPGKEPISMVLEGKSNHEIAIETILKTIVGEKTGVINSLDEIEAVGHRLVHGGDKFSESVLINNEVIETLYQCVDFAPLHNPHNIKGIEAAQKNLPNVQNVGVFDTSFHSTLPKVAYLYGIPYDLYKEMGIRRYGFHGTSHYFVSKKAAEMIGKPIEDLKLITCHLGNGASITAIKNGKSIDTSMGFTPLEGLIMGTRCGDIDPGVIFHIANKEEFTMEETNHFFNKRCGMLGLTGYTSDMLDIENDALKGKKRARMALDIYNYRIIKYIGAYAAAMNGVDAIVFTGGIGENSDIIRKEILSDMDYLGIKIDHNKNNGLRGKSGFINSDDSKTKVLVVPTNEELVIALETSRMLS